MSIFLNFVAKAYILLQSYKKLGRGEEPNLEPDLKDRKILVELDKNARQSFSEIGEKIKMSPQLVRFRVNRMVEEGIIKGFVTFVNLEKLGNKIFNMCIQLKHMPEDREHELIERLKQVPHINWLCSTNGRYDLIIGVNAADMHQFQFIFSQITSIFEHEIIDDGMFFCMDSWQMPYPLVKGQEKPLDTPEVGVKLHPIVKLQPIDYHIIQELAGNARITSHDIAKKHKADIHTVTQHIDSLIKNKIIMAFKPLIDMTKLGYQWHLVLFKLKYVDPHTRQQFMEFLKTLPQTFFVVHGFGNWDMQAEFYCKDDHDYNQVMNTIFPDKFHNIIKNQHEIRILKEHKCNWYPVGKVEEPYQSKIGDWTQKSKVPAKEKELRVPIRK